MKVFIGIATTGRGEILHHALVAITKQTLAPDGVIICTPRMEHFDETCIPTGLNVQTITADKGSCAQRNAILDHLAAEDGLILIIDDDFITQRDYLARVRALMLANPDLALVNGTLLKDGIIGPGLSIAEALGLLTEADSRAAEHVTIAHNPAAYGCNMAINLTHARTVRFDENLPLYGWLEDVDFSSRLSRYGRIVRTNLVSGVHLGVKLGRTSGLRFGYSQVVNPIYLIRKGTMRPRHGLWLICRNIGMNLVHSVRPEPYIDRRGRLGGNLRGLGNVLMSRGDPRRVLSF